MSIVKIVGGDKNLAKVIHTGEPHSNGLYLVWISPESHLSYARRRLMKYSNSSYGGLWTFANSSEKYVGPVHAWVGPIPFIEVEDLAVNLQEE